MYKKSWLWLGNSSVVKIYIIRHYKTCGSLSSQVPYRFTLLGCAHDSYCPTSGCHQLLLGYKYLPCHIQIVQGYAVELWNGETRVCRLYSLSLSAVSLSLEALTFVNLSIYL